MKFPLSVLAPVRYRSTMDDLSHALAEAHGIYRRKNPCGDCLSVDYFANETRSGWTVGAGIEYALFANWSVKLEYDYLHFGNSTPTFLGTTPGDTFTEVIANRINEVKVGLNYKFGNYYAPVGVYK